ncbi:MAG TPA: NAD(P)H-binding protein [Planctomycetota bacterium]|nr:NAD(P)H-binding protein [Planctomycetota bacterium]
MILLTGATGYVGGRLLKAFERQRIPVRALVRRAVISPGPSTTEWVTGDVLDEVSLRRAMTGVRTAYYLIHSMAAPGHFAERDRDAARRFGEAAQASGVERIIYLGGLGGGGDLSEHLTSRQEVGRILRESDVLVVEFRASIIVGSGSLSYEIVRALVDKLPVMITPRWVTTLAQPIAIDDVVEYLQEAAQQTEGGTFEIGGADQVSYGGLMREYARQKGCRRLLIRVPVLSPGLSGLWLRLMAPRYARVGRALIEGVRNETVVRNPEALSRFGVRPRGIAEAIRCAREEQPPETPALRGAAAATALLVLLVLCMGAAIAWKVEGPRLIPYALAAVAAWLIVRRDGLTEARLALGMFAVSVAAGHPIGALPVLVTAALFFVRSRLAAAFVLPLLLRGWL